MIDKEKLLKHLDFEIFVALKLSESAAEYQGIRVAYESLRDDVKKGKFDTEVTA